MIYSHPSFVSPIVSQYKFLSVRPTQIYPYPQYSNIVSHRIYYRLYPTLLYTFVLHKTSSLKFLVGIQVWTVRLCEISFNVHLLPELC